MRWQVKATAVRAGDLMTSPALSIDADASLTRAARTMQVRNVRRLPVAGPQGRGQAAPAWSHPAHRLTPLSVGSSRAPGRSAYALPQSQDGT